jgi:hypothetical protein
MPTLPSDPQNQEAGQITGQVTAGNCQGVNIPTREILNDMRDAVDDLENADIALNIGALTYGKDKHPTIERWTENLNQIEAMISILRKRH